MTYVYTCETVTLSDAVAATAIDGMLGITYGVDAARFVRMKNGSLMGFDGAKENPIDLVVPYEARIFGKSFELRWVHEADGTGRAAIVAEEEVGGLPNSWALDDSDWLHHLERRYLLWEVLDTNGSWTRLASRRIGAAWIPGAFKTKHVCLVAYEYPAVGHDGNVSIVAERYVGLDEYRPPKAKGGEE